MKQVKLATIGIFILTLFLAAQSWPSAQATEIYNDSDVVVYNDSYVHRSVFLQEDDAMAVYFRINNGDGVTFFIVDSFGHSEIAAEKEASTSYNKTACPRGDGGWWWFRFRAPDTDTWYAYFSKDYGTTYYTGSNAELDIIVRTETDGPSVEVKSSLPEHARGTVTISFTAIDDCYAIDRVELSIDGVLVQTVLGSPSSNTLEDSFAWASYNWANGNHTLSIKAYDTYGHEGIPFTAQVNVYNEWYDNPIILAVAVGIAMLVLFLLIRRYIKSKARH